MNYNPSALGIMLTCSLCIVLVGSASVYAVDFYSKTDTPFGIPSDIWLQKWWMWWIKTNAGGNVPVPGGCIINKSDSMVMLMETTVSGEPQQVCEISSTQGIIIPLWTGFFDADAPDLYNYTDAQLTKAAREQVNLGAVTSLVKVDGAPLAKLDEISSMRAGTLDYKINSMKNVTEVSSKGFNITIPEDTNYADLKSGTYRAGAHGWFVFMKPLPIGEHTVYYNVGVSGTGPNDHSVEITYDLKVK